jgi:DNA polymerase-3 subunit epsilon
MHYVALDFETANEYAGGACAVALVRFDEEGSVLDQYYTLIRPKEPYFDPSMSAVHKLNSEECLAAGEFDTIWGDMLRFIGGDLVVAHNAPFDMGVLKGALEVYDLQCDGLSYLCTLAIARRIWPKMLSYRLSYIVESLELEYRPHYALDDALMCGKIMAKLCCGHLNDLLSLRRFLITKGIEVKRLDHQRRGEDLFL